MGEGEIACPDCAETIKEAARVCKHCGFRFPDTARANAPPLTATVAPSFEVYRCPSCSKPTTAALDACRHCKAPLSAAGPHSYEAGDNVIPDGQAGWWERVFGAQDAAGAKYGCLGIAALILGSVWMIASYSSDDESSITTESASQKSSANVSDIRFDTAPTVSAIDYNTDQLSMICRAGIAAEFGRDPAIMNATLMKDGLIRVSYRRPNDPKVWKSDCKVEGNRIVWRTVDAFAGDGPGRWRTSDEDDILTFKLKGNSVTTQSSDGSSASETYRF